MNTTTEKKMEVPSRHTRFRRLTLVLVIVLLVFIVACLSLTIFIIAQQKTTQPKPMVLQHPSDTTVPAGVSRQDLKRIMELSKELAKSNIKSVLNGTESGNLSQMQQESLKHLRSFDELLTSGRITRIKNGTRCVMVTSGWNLCQVRITQGPHNGKHFWVFRRCLSRPANEDIPEELFCGFMCASIYIRYFITASICCVGIYALKLKSLFVQITLFIIGMFLLNLLWARIAMLMIL